MNSDVVVVVVSKSLIRTTKPSSLTKENESNFCLGVPGWCPCSNCSEFAMASTSSNFIDSQNV